MSIGHSPTHPQHTPDMRKDASDVTEADKKDAKRRIQGSGFADDTGAPSGDDSSGSDGLSMTMPGSVARAM
jgi:phosphatidylserine decarboxylase